nr:MAG TPA: hypothetical protein [Caudoviricetes sp.]
MPSAVTQSYRLHLSVNIGYSDMIKSHKPSLFLLFC